MDFSKLDEIYIENPPHKILDDIGIFVSVEVPLPAKYVRSTCLCGIIHKWEFPETFYIHEIELIPGLRPLKKIKKCKTCEETLTLELYKD